MNKNTVNDIINFIATLAVAVGFVVLLSALAYSFNIPEDWFNVPGKVNAKGEFAKFIASIMGGVLVLWGLLVSYRKLQTTNEQIQLAEKAQINTRFKDAAQLLASEHTSAILSGIYALDQIAVEVSKSDDEQYKGYVKVIHDILCAYLRENSVLDEENRTTSLLDKKGEPIRLPNKGRIPIGRKRTDIVFQTIVSQLFINNESVYSGLEANLRSTYLARLDLRNADLQGASMEHANLQRAWLSHVKLQRAMLYDVKLQQAGLSHAKLQRAELWNTNFDEAFLYDAKFQGAKFYKTDFSNAKMDLDTDFSKTRLAGYSIEEITQLNRSIELTS